MEKDTDSNITNSPKISKNDLKKILTHHSLWLHSDESEGEMANLERSNLRGAVLLGANLVKANFKMLTYTEHI